MHSVRKRSVQKPHQSLLPPRFSPFQYPYRKHRSSSAPLLLRIPLPVHRLFRSEGCSGKIRSHHTRITAPSGSDIRLLFSAKVLFVLRASGHPMLFYLSQDSEDSYRNRMQQALNLRLYCPVLSCFPSEKKSEMCSSSPIRLPHSEYHLWSCPVLSGIFLSV